MVPVIQGGERILATFGVQVTPGRDGILPVEGQGRAVAGCQGVIEQEPVPSHHSLHVCDIVDPSLLLLEDQSPEIKFTEVTSKLTIFNL